MTIQKRLVRSNLAMLVIPALAVGVLLAVGAGLALILLTQVYLPRLGLSLEELHQSGEQLEHAFSGLKLVVCVYAGGVAIALAATVALTNYWLTRRLFCRIAAPLDALTEGVARIRDGDLDAPIAYGGADEFKPVCDGVDELAARLKASLEEQQRQQQRRQELIVGMSHDLKSPMTSIRAYTEALLDGVARDENARSRYLRTIQAKERDMEGMVDRLFQFAKLDVSAYPIQPEPVSLAQALGEIVDQWAGEGLDISLDISPELTVTADRALLARIAANLLDNSRKYGGRDTVRITITAQAAGEQAELAFTDNGPGVPPEQLPRLFDPFYRGDAARTAPEQGSGLGLSVVKKAAEAMNGSVRAENVPEGGLRITVTLPLAKEE